jgi:hypothetical protein
VELGTPKPRLQPGQSGEYGRRGPVLLFRDQLIKNNLTGLVGGRQAISCRLPWRSPLFPDRFGMVLVATFRRGADSRFMPIKLLTDQKLIDQFHIYASCSSEYFHLLDIA